MKSVWFVKNRNMHQNCICFGQKCSPANQNVPQAPLAVLAGFLNSVQPHIHIQVCLCPTWASTAGSSACCRAPWCPAPPPGRTRGPAHPPAWLTALIKLTQRTANNEISEWLHYISYDENIYYLFKTVLNLFSLEVKSFSTCEYNLTIKSHWQNINKSYDQPKRLRNLRIF